MWRMSTLLSGSAFVRKSPMGICMSWFFAAHWNNDLLAELLVGDAGLVGGSPLVVGCCCRAAGSAVGTRSFCGV